MFQDELGTLEGFQAKIYVDPDVVLPFCRARPLAYAVRPLVEEELERSMKQGVIEPVTHADWVALIVSVLKTDRSL